MEIKFKCQAASLNAALEVVSIVDPMSITQQGGTGYLFVVRKDDQGQDQCYIYSRDRAHVSRAHFPVTEVEGEGPFVYPAQHIKAFTFAEGEITFTAKSDGDNHTIKYNFMDSKGRSAGTERPTFDPKLLTSCDKKLQEAGSPREFNVALLREALTLSRPFLPKENQRTTEEHYKNIIIYDDAKGDGHLFAANGVQAFYFLSEAFKGTGLQIHSQHLPFVTNFLSKCEGRITVTSSADMTFATDETGHRVLGWVHHAKSQREFKYYPTKMDKVILAVPKAQAVHALGYCQTELEKHRDKIKIHFKRSEADPATGTLQFEVVEGGNKTLSLPIDVRVKPESDENRKDYSFNINIDQLIDLFKESKANDVELRMAPLEPGGGRQKEMAMFRTIDEYWLDKDGKIVGGSELPPDKQPKDGMQCRVTRFMPSKEQ